METAQYQTGQINTLHTICLTSKHRAPQPVQKFSGLSNNGLTMMRASQLEYVQIRTALILLGNLPRIYFGSILAANVYD